MLFFPEIEEDRMAFRQRYIVPLFAVAAIAAPAFAQQQPPTIIQRIRLSKVKSDRVADYEAAIKEYVSVLKKASSRHGFSTWVSLTGDHEYARVDNFTKWAELDVSPYPHGPDIAEQDLAQLQRIGLRINTSEETSRTVILTISPELNMASGQPLPPMVGVTWMRLGPGKMADYRSAAKSALAAWKSTGFNFVYIAEVANGDYMPQAVGVRGIKNWAEIDGDAARAAASEDWQNYVKQARPLVQSRKSDVYRFQPGLSYLPASEQTAQK